MDRNEWIKAQYSGCRVALRKESVDRNMPINGTLRNTHKSLSARRAWIEMLASRLVDMSAAVALRKESVDRNITTTTTCTVSKRSLSARRAWIEMLFGRC